MSCVITTIIVSLIVLKSSFQLFLNYCKLFQEKNTLKFNIIFFPNMSKTCKTFNVCTPPYHTKNTSPWPLLFQKFITNDKQHVSYSTHVTRIKKN